MATGEDGREALDALYWRSEILQALFWMRGEDLGSEVEPGVLARFLAVDAAVVTQQVGLLAAAGYLEPAAPGPPGRYRLTALGIAEGGRSFQDDFADLTRPGHYECSASCWCHDPDHADEPCPTHPEQPHDA